MAIARHLSVFMLIASVFCAYTAIASPSAAGGATASPATHRNLMSEEIFAVPVKYMHAQPLLFTLAASFVVTAYLFIYHSAFKSARKENAFSISNLFDTFLTVGILVFFTVFSQELHDGAEAIWAQLTARFSDYTIFIFFYFFLISMYLASAAIFGACTVPRCSPVSHIAQPPSTSLVSSKSTRSSGRSAPPSLITGAALRTSL